MLRNCVFILFLLIAHGSLSAADMTIVFSSNLGGAFSLQQEKETTSDPMLLLFETILKERETSSAFYLDLGNSLFPGQLSKYSVGSVMADFFRFSGCSGSLVSSRDLSMQISSLSYLAQSGAPLMSATIRSDGKLAFRDHTILTDRGFRLGVIPLTSDRAVFSQAEKNLASLEIDTSDKTIRSAIDAASPSSDIIIAMSGLDLRSSLRVMSRFPQIRHMICGGDNTGKIMDSQISRLDLGAGRSILFLPGGSTLYRIIIRKTGEITSVSEMRPSHYRSNSSNFSAFHARITLWKTKYAESTKGWVMIPENQRLTIDAAHVAKFLRRKYRAEISILENPIEPLTLSNTTSIESLLSSILDNYSIFTYELTGSEIMSLYSKNEGQTISGTDGKVIQGYPINTTRKYRICSTQPTYESIKKTLWRDVPFYNSFRNLTDEFTDDIAGPKTILMDNDPLLQSTIRSTLDVALSFFREGNSVSKDENVSTPAGRSSKSYKKIGTESKADLTIYNASNRLVITPYIYYIKQDKQYLQNIFRLSAIYTYNTHPNFKPYNKVQLDSQVVETDHKRPTIFRETAGLNAETGYFSARIGAGFEKQIQDDSGPIIYGIECYTKYSTTFFTNFTYGLLFDSFASYNPKSDKPADDGYVKIAMDNSISYNLNASISISVKHRYYRYYSIGFKESYTSKQLTTSLDVKTDFKLY